MPERAPKKVRDLLLRRQGLVFLDSDNAGATGPQVRAVELELAQLGYVASARLSAELARCSPTQLAEVRAWALAELLAHAGGDQKHVPLFRRFPDGVPDDTFELWWTKVLSHFLQDEDQPCIFCRRRGTTHVLRPCQHVVCDHCFDGSNYSACPVCEREVEQPSPFFKAEDLELRLPQEKVVFRLLDLGHNDKEAGAALFKSLCQRTQALSPDDREALGLILREHGEETLSWLPDTIPLRENIATVFGILFQTCSAHHVLEHARRFMTTATDVLRLIAVASGTDGFLMPETVFTTTEQTTAPSRFWGRIAALLGAPQPGPVRRPITVPIQVRRFKVAKLPRSVRRALLALLDGIPEESLIEDMLRHRSYWVWVGEFLHPGEYAARFPRVAVAFRVVRKKSPDGTPAPAFRTWNARVEDTIRAQDLQSVLALLEQRPGEFARRLDHVLRIAQDVGDPEAVTQAFLDRMPAMATPVLLTLASHLPRRVEKAGVRVYWPKGRVATGASSGDVRPRLTAKTVGELVGPLRSELLKRFASKLHFESCVIDEQLRDVMVPFNERTASKAAVSLPRGSRVSVPSEKVVRLFLHWCQPQTGGHTTDLDLSVGFYDENWQYVGVCSYYELKHSAPSGGVIAQSAGDRQDAPWPDGATEYVDLHREPALSTGIRYAVMVVNAYAGMPFSLLDRAFAGLMLRDDPDGKHFDPRTVRLRFALEGERGVYLPLVFDLRNSTLHWLDVHAKGQFEMNNVETSKAAIAKLCPELITYFGSGTRPSMYELALYHGAARSERVVIRGSETKVFQKQPGESSDAFHDRLVRGTANQSKSESRELVQDHPSLAFLHEGDVDLPEGSEAYVLFRQRTRPTVTGADLVT